MTRHLIKRFGFFLLGIVLLYAPFALLTRLMVWATQTPLISDAHRLCLRMPIQWLFQPWMYPTLAKQPMYWVAILVQELGFRLGNEFEARLARDPRPPRQPRGFARFGDGGRTLPPERSPRLVVGSTRANLRR